jgi:ABC-type multidrug transport system ATPase subunit
MTVKEHLLFYGKLKENMGSKELKRDINEYNYLLYVFKIYKIKYLFLSMILKMGLNPYANDLVSCLSGGVRRRLEVAIAFVAGSKTVILGISLVKKLYLT